MDKAEITSLAYYVIQTYKDFEQNRKDLSEKWEKNLNAFRRLNNGYWKDDEAEGWRSQVFDAITKQKIVSAVALCVSAYCQGGKIPFDLKPSPFECQDIDLLPDAEREDIEQRMEKMRAKIVEQLDWCQADRAMIQHFLSGAIYGLTYAKCSIGIHRQKRYVPIADTLSPSGQSTRFEKVVEEIEAPWWNYVTPWDIFTDYEEKDITKAHAVIHRQMLSAFQIREMLKGQPGVIEEELTRALANETAKMVQDDSSSEMPPALRDVPNRKQNIRYLEYWGRVPKSALDDFSETKQLKLWSVSEWEDDEKMGDMVEVLVGVIGETAVRVAILDSADDRPVFRAVWEDNFDGQGGIGIADNTEDVQLMRNGIRRLFFDNKALSANVMLALKRDLLMKDIKSFKPGQKIDISAEADDVRQAIQQIVIQDVGETLLNALAETGTWADEDSMIPRVQQGGSGKSSETAYELAQRLDKSGKYLALVMQNYDNGLTEPIGNWFYDINMQDPQIDGKGSYILYATGFTSFQERLEKLTAIRELLNIAMSFPNPRIKVLEMFKAVCKMSDIDPDAWIMTEEEASQLPPDPVQEATLAKLQAETESIQAKAQNEAALVQIKAEELKLRQMEAMRPEKAA